jgi:ribonuclease-3
MEELEKILGYEFKDKNLLVTALTHSSYSNESGGDNYERFEFLGDSVLGMIVSEYIFLKFPELSEGRLTKIRSSLVCEKTLKFYSLKMNIGKFLRLSRGENRNGGRERASILADVFESVIAAIFLDGGIKPAKELVLSFISENIDNIEEYLPDYKSEIQEVNQTSGNNVVSYVLVNESGPDHNKKFTIELRINGKPAGIGTGGSKKEAEQLAAKNALKIFE